VTGENLKLLISMPKKRKNLSWLKGPLKTKLNIIKPLHLCASVPAEISDYKNLRSYRWNI